MPWQTTGFEDGVRWTTTELFDSLGVVAEGGAGGYQRCRTAADDYTTVGLEWSIGIGCGNGAGVHAQSTTEFDGSGNQALAADLHERFDCTACTAPPNGGCEVAETAFGHHCPHPGRRCDHAATVAAAYRLASTLILVT